MPYAIELFFDGAAEKKLKKAWADVSKKAKLPNHMKEKGGRPHLSLAVFNSAPLEQLSAALDEIVLNQSPFDVRFDSVGMFAGKKNGVIFLAPALNRELLKIHAMCHQKLRDTAEGLSDHYLPGRLVFHSTLNMGLNPVQLGKAASASFTLKMPILGKVVEMGLMKVPDNEAVKSFKLAQQ